MFSINVDGTKEPRSRLARWLIGIAATGVGVCVAVLGVGIWALNTQPARAQVTSCGVDAQGPYMEVRVNSLKGALGSRRHVGLDVAFAYDNHVYDQGAPISFTLTGWHTHARVHAKYPTRHLGHSADVTVQGRVVYRTPGLVVRRWAQHGAYREYGPGLLVPKARVERVTRLHPRWKAAHAKQEIAPNATSKISCILYSVSVQGSDD
jgi:hypothetical protein